ncbi:MAG: hypothetical protein ABIG61_15440 [Planctomycetota bacterium]
MAITLKTNSVSGAGFIANGYSDDWSGCETLVAAVTGKSIYIERIYINAHDAEIFTFGAGETGTAVTTVVLGPLSCSADTVIELVFTRPLFITAATAFVVDATATGDATIIVQGYIK